MDDLDLDDDPIQCPACDGHGEPLGTLGIKEYYRCRDCGITFTHDGDDDEPL